MEPNGIVPTFDEAEAGHSRLGLGRESLAIKQLTFERSEEALAHRVVVSVADGPHRWPHTGLAAPGAEGERGVLAPLVGMIDDVPRPPLTDRHVERVEHQLGAKVVRYRPADDLPAPGVQHHGEKQEAGHGRHERAVRDSKPVRPRRREIAIHEIRRGTSRLVAAGRRDAAATAADAGEARVTH